jgi:hypothetical protein
VAAVSNAESSATINGSATRCAMTVTILRGDRCQLPTYVIIPDQSPSSKDTTWENHSELSVHDALHEWLCVDEFGPYVTEPALLAQGKSVLHNHLPRPCRAILPHLFHSTGGCGCSVTAQSSGILGIQYD